MVNTIRNGLLILYTYKEAILFYCVTALGLGIFAFKQFTDDMMEGEISLTGAFGFGTLILCLTSYGLVILSHFFSYLLRFGSYAILAFGLFALLQSIYLGELKLASRLNFMNALLGLALLWLLCVRLAFLKYIILPPYSDSPIHYQIVQGFLYPEATLDTKLSLSSIFTNYYHFGFHSMAAWLASIADLDPAKAIPLLGQLFLILGPLSIIFLVKTVTASNQGAILAGLLAAMGWHMPAFAVNWGKYPALAALAILPVTLAFLWLSSQDHSKANKGILWALIFAGSTILLHTRMVICLLLFIVGDVFASRLKFDPELSYSKSIIYSIFYLVILWPFMPILNEFYNGFIVAVPVIILLPFAFQQFPNLATRIFLFTFCIWLVSMAPISLNQNYLVLLDRQFVAMLLYIPFSILGGLSLAAITKKESITNLIHLAMVPVFWGAVIINFWWNQPVYPDTCCNYYQTSDQIAFNWLQQHISKHALVIISADNDTGQLVGTDAGIWLTPLLSQPTNKLSFDFNWALANEIQGLCQRNTSEIFIYMGGRNFSFDNSKLEQAKWIQPVFTVGNIIIYKISACP